VRTAVIRAAAALFASRGPAAVSIRDVATRAKVNHGLVHRHFGSKQALLRAVLSHAVHEMAESIQDGAWTPETQARLVRSLFAHGDYLRVLARALLDGERPARIQREHPLMHGMIEAFRGKGARRAFGSVRSRSSPPARRRVPGVVSSPS
jgi:AcrR family transcriptional regulator